METMNIFSYSNQMVIFTVLMKPGVIESSQSKARTRSFQKRDTNVVTVMAECPSYDRRDPNSANNLP